MSNVVSPSPAAPEANGQGVIVPSAPKSIEERAAEVFGSSAPAAEESSPAPGTPDPSAVGSVELDAAAQKRAERRAALAEVQRQERERVDAMTAIRERDQLRKENEELRQRTKAYETHIDPSKLTKEQFFALAEKNPELTPQELGEWLRERMANPELAAAKAAKTALDPEIAKLREELAAEREWRKQFEASQQSAIQEHEERMAAANFVAFAREAAPQLAPLTASFLATFGEEEFLKVARSAASSVVGGPQALLDEVEEGLSKIPWLKPVANQQRQASVPTRPAPVAQGGITNTLAQQRSSVVDEDAEFSKLSIDERAARIFGT